MLRAILSLLIAPCALALNVSPLVAAGVDLHAPTKVGPITGITTDSYAGLITTNVTDNAEAFYWYFPALNGNASAPVLVCEC